MTSLYARVARRWRRRSAALVTGALVLMALLLQPAVLWAADPPGRWTLSDRQEQRWVLSLFAQPDPAYPAGARLRLTALSAPAGQGGSPSHRLPLELADAFAGTWRLPNRSNELVPPDTQELPPESAQFGLDPLTSPPRAEGPVVLRIPLSNGERTTLVLGPAPTAALGELIAQR